MANLNRVFLIGNLTRDPELRYTSKGTAVAELGLAINRTWRDESNEKREETTYVGVTLWGRLAEVAERYLQKGDPVFIEGRLQLNTWEDRTGQKHSTLRVVAENLQLLGSRDSVAASSSPRAPAQRQQACPGVSPTVPESNPSPSPPRGVPEPDLDPF